jgi:hypothetical protein
MTLIGAYFNAMRRQAKVEPSHNLSLQGLAYIIDLNHLNPLSRDKS